MKDVKTIQAALGIPQTGIYDEFTEAAVRNYQLKHSISPSGVIDAETASLLEEPIMSDVTPSTDLSEVKYDIAQYRLRRGQYINGPTEKEYVFLHHTAGWENPFSVVDQWANDNRGPIATQFVIGGKNCQTLSDKYDGDIVECFGYENYGWHLGLGNIPIHVKSIGIELCNFGYVTQTAGQYKTYIGKAIQSSEIVDLKQTWRGQRYFHKYTDRQIESLQFLLKKIANDVGINIRSGLQERLKKMDKFKAFDFDATISSGKTKGVFTHANVSGPNKYGGFEKWDLFPQDEICDMILSI